MAEGLLLPEEGQTMTTADEVEETRAIVEAARQIGNGIPWQGFKIAVEFYCQAHPRTVTDALAECSKKE